MTYPDTAFGKEEEIYSEPPPIIAIRYLKGLIRDTRATP